MEFNREAYEQHEIRKTKLIQIGITAGALLSLILGYVTDIPYFAIPIGLSIWGGLVAFQTRTYMPKDEQWKKNQKLLVAVLGLVVVLSLFVFPSDPDCYTEWDIRSSRTYCK
jgi:hypothetical protein